MTLFTVGWVSPRQLKQPRQPPIGPILCRKPITETLFPGRHVWQWKLAITHHTRVASSQALHTVGLSSASCSFVIYILYGSCLSVFTFLQPLLGLQSHRRLLLKIHLSLLFLLAIFFSFFSVLYLLESPNSRPVAPISILLLHWWISLFIHCSQR